MMTSATTAFGGSDAPAYVDINNLSLSEEPLGEGFDPSAELYTSPAPVPDDTYNATITFSSEDPTQQWTIRKNKQDGSRYYSTQLKATISDGPFAGRVVFDNFVSTMLFANSGTSKIAGLIRSIGGFDEELAEAATHEDLVRLFTRAVASGPSCRVTTRWTATEKLPGGQYNDFLKGMRSFPQNSDGTYQHIVKGEQSDEEITARAGIVRYGTI